MIIAQILPQYLLNPTRKQKNLKPKEEMKNFNQIQFKEHGCTTCEKLERTKYNLKKYSPKLSDLRWFKQSTQVQSDNGNPKSNPKS